MKRIQNDFLSKQETEMARVEVLSVAMLQHVYDSLLQGQRAHLLSDYLVSSLELTALESEDANDLSEFLQRKRDAFACLRLISFNLSEDFCLIFYDSIVMTLQVVNPELIGNAGLNKLNAYMNSPSPLQDKIVLLQSLTTCLCVSDVNFSVFDNFPENVWRRKLLLYTLLAIHHALDMGTVERMTELIRQLEEFLVTNDVEWSVEDVLEKLISYQKENCSNIHFTADLVIVIGLHPEVYYMLSQNYDAVQEKVNELKYEVLLGHSDFVEGLSENDFESLQYLLTLPLAIIVSILSAVTSDSLAPVTAFVQMLRCCKLEQSALVDFLFNLNFNNSIDTLKYKLLFHIVKNIIYTYFPCYKTYTKDQMFLDYKQMSEISVSCRCFDINKKCQFHHAPNCCNLLYTLNCNMARVISCCTKIPEKSFESIDIIISRINKSQKILELINALETLEEYHMEFTETEFSELFTDFVATNFERDVHKTVVEHSFSGTYEKSAQQLIEDIESYNPGLTPQIIELFIDVQNAYENKSTFFPQCECIKMWSESQIKLWALIARRTTVDDAEKLAVLKRAAKVTVGLHVRDVQLLAIITILKSNMGKGRLCQVNTGEGKTLIIAMAAAFKVLEGRKVDIYTSSPILAIPQSLQFKQFYDTCGLSVTNNIAPKSNYDCDVIYGTNNSFQRDVLQDEFRKNSVRKTRHFDVGLVDEVDNMLIDGNNWILKLSCDMPAMDYLEVLLAAIYMQVNAVASALIEKNGEVYFREEEEIFDEDGNVKPQIKYRDIPIKESKKDFIIKCTEHHIRKLIRDTGDEKVDNNYPEIKIPKHLREVITKIQIKKWIESAIQSIFNYVKDEDYVLEKEKITIVDVNNTGVLKKNSHWSNGLHQFLQIKHGAKIDPENFTSNFISNVALFTRYSSIFGLTGTLGSKDTRMFLHETYEVDSVIIPPFKLKQHIALKPILLSDTKSWYLEIARNCIQKLQNGRAVLIIMNYIRETVELANVFKEHFNYKNSKIKLYTKDSDADVVESPLNSGDVIITTNIAGRGTDIKLNKNVETNGGLHVCLTFLPINSRVEEQNIGRTSRKGNRGTSQLILDISGNNSACIEDLKSNRSKKETSYINGAMSTVKKIKIKDKIFQQFCHLLSMLKGRNSYVKKTELQSVEEQFAIWLQIHQDTFDDENSNPLEKFEEFKKPILENDRCGKLIRNPYIYVELGNKYLEKKEFQKSISEFTEAIDLDQNFAENAFNNRAWAYLELYGGNLKENEYFIRKAVSDLKTARKLIQSKEYALHLLQTASKSEVFSEQVTNKLNLYNLQKNVIEMAIGPDADAIDEQLNQINNQLKQTNDVDSKTKDKLIELRNKLREDKENVGVIGRAMKNNRDIKIEPLPDDFIPASEKKKYEDEINEFQRNGWLPGFKITEIKPIDWVSVISLLGIGLGQLIIGAVITVFTLGTGSSIGMGFISEGVSDIITAVKDGIINRDFDWATWALMKVISLTVSIVCAGIKAIKDVARTAYSGVKNIATSGLKAFNKVTTEGFKIAAKKLGFELAKAVGKEIVTELVNYGIDKSLIPILEEAIIELVRVPIENNLSNNSKVMRMLQLDEKNKNHVFENQIRAIGQSLLTPKGNSKFKTIAMHTASCISGNLGLGSVHKVITILKGSVDFSVLTFEFINKFNKAIDEIKLEEKVDINSSDKEENQNEVIENEASKSYKTDEEIDLNKIKQEHEQVEQKTKRCTPSDLSNDFAGMVSTNMMQIMKGSVLSPITQLAASYSVDGLSSKINKSLEHETETFRAGKRISNDNNRMYENAAGNSETQHISLEDFEQVNSLIESVEAGGPVSLIHLGAISKAADKPIEVYDHNGDLMFPVRNNQGGEPIKLQYHGNEDGVGHFTLLGKKEPLVTGADNNMCAFNCVAQLCNKDPNQLKADTVNILKNNKIVLATRLNDIKMIETSRKSVMSLKGGAEYYGKNYLDALQYISSSEGKLGFQNNKSAHPEIHISYKGDQEVRLAMFSEVIGKKIIVKGKKGNEMYTTGSQFDGDPIILQYNVDKMDPAKSYFSEPGGKDKLFFNRSDDSSFYKFMGKKTNNTPEALKTATDTKLNNFKVPHSANCVENKKATNKPPSGFFTKEDEAFVLHHVLKSKTVVNKLAQLNRYKPGQRQGKGFTKVPLTIPVQDLNLPRPVEGGQWANGQLICTFPIQSVFILLQHHDGHQTNPKAQVQIQTIYPPH